MILKEIDGRTTAEPETEAERKALEYLSKHRPIFAMAEQYCVASFIAGYEQAKAEMERYYEARLG